MNVLRMTRKREKIIGEKLSDVLINGSLEEYKMCHDLGVPSVLNLNLFCMFAAVQWMLWSIFKWSLCHNFFIWKKIPSSSFHVSVIDRWVIIHLSRVPVKHVYMHHCRSLLSWSSRCCLHSNPWMFFDQPVTGMF